MIKKTLIIPTSRYSEIIQTREILLCKGSGSYTEIYLKEENKLTVSKNLNWFEKRLCNECFFRAHKSYIVNLLHINKIFKRENVVCLINGAQIPISRAKKDLLWEKFENFQ
jgi:two-component system, LytTR family, response regulator